MMSPLSFPGYDESAGPKPTMLLEQGTEGLAILDQERRIVYINPAGAAILRARPEELRGTVADQIFDSTRAAPVDSGFTRVGRATLPDDHGPILVDFVETPIGDYTYASFRDQTDQARRDSHYSAFVRAAATLATVRSEKAILDEVAECVLAATGQASCTLVSFDRETHLIKQVGTAGGYPDDYADRVARCLELGAPLPSLEAFRTGELLVGYGWRERVLADERWAPVHDLLRDARWGSLVAVPLTYQDRTIGAVTLFYHQGQDPGKGDVRFISTIGEMAAVAMVNHELATRRARESALEERHRIARDLHDSVSQKIFGISLRSRALQMATDALPDTPKEITDQLSGLHDLTVEALAEMREMIHHLRPEALESEGLLGLIRRHVESLRVQSDIDFRVSTETTSVELSYADQLELYRIVQEALANAVRHSGARTIDVRLSADEDSFRVHVKDDGGGFEIHEQKEGHFGLRTMAERATKLGASIAIDSRPGATTVRVTVPVRGRITFFD